MRTCLGIVFSNSSTNLMFTSPCVRIKTVTPARCFLVCVWSPSRLAISATGEHFEAARRNADGQLPARLTTLGRSVLFLWRVASGQWVPEDPRRPVSSAPITATDRAPFAARGCYFFSTPPNPSAPNVSARSCATRPVKPRRRTAGLHRALLSTGAIRTRVCRAACNRSRFGYRLPAPRKRRLERIPPT